MTLIPVDRDEIPSPSATRRFKPLDESLTYHVMLKKFDEASKLDKNGDPYLSVQVEIIEPVEYKGRYIFDGYVRKPRSRKQLEAILGRKPNQKELEELEDKNARFWQVFHCFSIPYQNGVDPDAGLGREGFVTIKNEMYKDEMRSRINDYLNTKDVRK